MILIPILVGLWAVGAVGYYKMQVRLLKHATETPSFKEQIDELDDVAETLEDAGYDGDKVLNIIVIGTMFLLALVWPLSFYIALIREAAKPNA